MDTLLEVEKLKVSFPTARGVVHAVNGISYSVRKGEVMGIIGESGSGKSVEAYSILGLLKPPGRIESGRVTFEGRNLLTLSKRELEAFRGHEVGMIFQDPLSSLDPVLTIGRQMTEVARRHDKGISAAEAKVQCESLLHAVGFYESSGRLMKQYPFELSGGQCQRVMIAMALLCRPKLLIADEPTTALDVTVQAKIMRLLKDLRKQRDMAMVYITHNVSIIAEICDSVSVMYGGTILEQGSAEDIFYRCAHPYTKALLEAVPRLDAPPDAPLLSIEGDPVDPIHPPGGCAFHPRCKHCKSICRIVTPPTTALAAQHRANCWMLGKKDD